MTNPVLVALAQAHLRAAPIFARWCELNGAIFCPAAPATVACFIEDCAPLGIERLWPAVQDISKLHLSRGLADPTVGGVAAAAINKVGGIAPPRSWPANNKQRFNSLPYDLQVFVAGHEIRRERALRRAQNEAAAAKRGPAFQHSSTRTNEGNEVHENHPRADTRRSHQGHSCGN